MACGLFIYTLDPSPYTLKHFVLIRVHSWLTLPRRFFTLLRCFLSASRFSFAARLGFVGILGLGGCSAFRISRRKRSRHSCRFRPWCRYRSDCMINRPSADIRRPANTCNRSFTADPRSVHPFRSNTNCARVFNLLTFCPPGPRERT